MILPGFLRRNIDHWDRRGLPRTPLSITLGVALGYWKVGPSSGEGQWTAERADSIIRYWRPEALPIVGLLFLAFAAQVFLPRV